MMRGRGRTTTTLRGGGVGE